jgi:hypothetical protein
LAVDRRKIALYPLQGEKHGLIRTGEPHFLQILPMAMRLRALPILQTIAKRLSRKDMRLSLGSLASLPKTFRMSEQISEQPDWDAVGELLAKLQPFEPDPYHKWAPGGKKTEMLPVSFQALDAIPRERDAPWPIFDAWCMFNAYGSDYYRETLLLGMAHRVRLISRTEDQFQTGLRAIWEELGRWKTNYPIDARSGEELHSDDIGKYLARVAKNAMHGGRKRKPVQVDNKLVEPTPDKDAEHERESDAKIIVMGVCRDDLDRKLLALKENRMAEKDMAAELGLSPDQVNRRLNRMYKQACAVLGLKPIPMGRAKPTT